jgi:hypothetical protein
MAQVSGLLLRSSQSRSARQASERGDRCRGRSSRAAAVGAREHDHHGAQGTASEAL